MMLMDKYIAGTFMISLLGFVLFYIMFLGTLSFKKKDGETRQNGFGRRTGTDSAECGNRKESDADVIVVGAGVAGAALAHTLGKV